MSDTAVPSPPPRPPATGQTEDMSPAEFLADVEVAIRDDTAKPKKKKNKKKKGKKGKKG